MRLIDIMFRDEKVFVKKLLLYSVNHGSDKDDPGGVCECAYVNLYELKFSKKRSYELIGPWPTSAKAKSVQASIKAWVHGGSEPVGQEWGDRPPNPKPRKPLPGKKPKRPKTVKSDGKVVEFPKKESAA